MTTLFTVARERWSSTDADRYDGLLGALEAGSLTDDQREELSRMRDAHDRLALRKAHAAALLKWRGRLVPAA